MNKKSKRRNELNNDGDKLKKNLVLGSLGFGSIGFIAFIILASVENWWEPIGQWFTSSQFIFVLISVLAFALVILIILHLAYADDLGE